MKLRKIVEASPAFKKLSAAELSFVKLYAVNKLLDSIDTELNFFDDNRDKIIKKYTENNQIKNENLTLINADIDKLLDTDVQVKYKKVTISEDDKLILSRNDMKSLEGFVEFIFNETEEDKHDK